MPAPITEESLTRAAGSEDDAAAAPDGAPPSDPEAFDEQLGDETLQETVTHLDRNFDSSGIDLLELLEQYWRRETKSGP